MKTVARAARSRERVIDPVCGMSVDADSPLRATHDGRTYRFCSAGCRAKFLRDPDRYQSVPSEIQRASHEQEHAGGTSARADGQQSAPANIHQQADARGTRWADYLPLVVIIALTLLAASAKQMAYIESWSARAWMHDFMGFFLVVFSMFKFFDLPGFADGFQMYDLLAKSFRPYAYVYAFIELGLGLAYLAAWTPPLVYGATILVTVVGSLGVIRALRKGLDVNCACMGTVLKVPLSTVALIEDLGMAAMAAVMWATE